MNQFRIFRRLSFCRNLGLLVTLLWTAAPASFAQSGLDADEGLPVVSWQKADQFTGRMGVVFGKIERVGHTKKIHFLNFHERDRDAFTAVIFEKAMANFDGKSLEDRYLHQDVKIRGMISTFNGKPQIVVTKPDQIQVVASLPKEMIPKQVSVPTGNELIVGSFNVKNLFDDLDDPYHNDETTPAKPREELERIARVIREINADVLALQEVENRGYLQKFINSMLSDMGYEHVVHLEGNDMRGIDVSLISRIPVGRVSSNRHRVFPAVDGSHQRFNRDLLMVELLPNGGDPFEMWVVHLKSNSGGKPENEPIRLGECHAIRKIIDVRLEQDPHAAFILCGDFNDTFDSKTLQTLIGTEATALKPLFGKVPVDQRVTYNRMPYRSMIDFLLCSPTMAERYVTGSYRIRNALEEESGSDHNPVYCRFRIRSSE